MIGVGTSCRLDIRSTLVVGLGLALPMTFACASLGQERTNAHEFLQTQSRILLAQNNDDDEKRDALKKHEKELEATRNAQRESSDTKARLTHEIEEIGVDRRKLNEALIGTAAKLRDLEIKVDATETRLAPLDENAARLRKSLETRRAVIGEVLAALQRIGYRPPPALIASPEDALKAVRTAMVLGAVLPDMRRKVDALVDDLSSLVAVRKEIAAERDKLKTQSALLASERTRMTALIAERQKQQEEREKSLQAEQTHAMELAQQVDNLEDLIAKLEQSLGSAIQSSHETRGDTQAALAALHDPGRLGPAVAFASLRRQVPMPVNGIKLREFGAPDGIGGTEKGLSIATRAGAQVTAPADGWVVYAGPFRSYGQLLILNVGGGYHLLLAGMDRISVDLGQFVLTGEPVAVMGSSSPIAAVLTTGSSQPVLYIEFRKDGRPVDPGPWWVAGEGEKVRG